MIFVRTLKFLKGNCAIAFGVPSLTIVILLFFSFFLHLFHPSYTFSKSVFDLLICGGIFLTAVFISLKSFFYIKNNFRKYDLIDWIGIAIFQLSIIGFLWS